ncbi:MAG: type I-U CRISPR-associated helicase/endonuclease Cas3 [Streptosporangiales bacterium]
MSADGVNQRRQDALDASHFRGFFTEVHGYAPFPWQEALLEEVLAGGWPELIDVPTGLGKTAVLDVATFASALQSQYARRRMFLVVDRRLIVDQAFEAALELQRKIAGAEPGTICGLARERLAVDGDDASMALSVTRMRGGVDWSWLWLERPDRHAIVTGTVDQIGSRMFFRGYGVGDKIRPIDAALAGVDSLIIIDEAHLSDPLIRTLLQARELDAGGVGRPPVVVAMSASPGRSHARVHGITSADEHHPVAGKRLQAPKSLHLVEVTAPASSAPSAVADALASWAGQFGGPGKAVGVVANTVGMARAAFERIRRDTADHAECVLLTGRIRPIDREYLLHEWYPRIRSGAARDPGAELYVVATQTIEAGADIDLDAMVTEAAPLPALVQRLGRVNRMGERATAPVVVVRTGKLRDLVYGSASEHTWDWLASLQDPLTCKPGRTSDLGGGIPASPAVLRALAESIPAEQHEWMRGPQPYVPVVSAAALDTWARTCPAPHPDVPVAPYLHGIGAGEPTVSLIWRADLPGTDPAGWAGSAERIPPSAEEALELPISAARQWLAQPGPGLSRASGQAQDTGTSDLESQADGAAGDPAAAPASGTRRALRYAAGGQPESVTPRQVRPGDLLVVPAAWGGCDRYGWHPGSAAPVTDLADFTGGRPRRTTAIRIGPALTEAVGVIAPDLRGRIAAFIAQVRQDIEEESAPSASADGQYRDLLRSLVASGQHAGLPHERVLRRLAAAGRLILPDGGDTSDGRNDPAAPVTALFTAPGVSWSNDASPAGTSWSPGRQPLSLAAHQSAVGRRAQEFAANLGLPGPLATAVELAARYHDEGKRDPRFQVMLHGGDQWQARAAAEPLAKSGMDPADTAGHRRAAHVSGYPPGMRHEALSAQIASAYLQQQDGDGLDIDLVVHLVAAHHGHARPLLPPIADPQPEKVRILLPDGRAAVFGTADTVDWQQPARFTVLCGRYGRWGLALLETIVRLADIWCSARSEACHDDRG